MIAWIEKDTTAGYRGDNRDTAGQEAGTQIRQNLIDALTATDGNYLGRWETELGMATSQDTEPELMVQEVRFETKAIAPLEQHSPADMYLYAASTLQAIALNIRHARGVQFEIEFRDLRSYSLENLAALARKHSGSLGQAFELQIADALNAGVPGVQNIVRDALSRQGHHMDSPEAVVIGLEKIRRRAEFIEKLEPILEGKSLLTGRPGRRPGATNSLRQLLDGGTQISSDREPLAFADLLVYDGGGLSTLVVPASVKIRAVGWAPNQQTSKMLWIIGIPGPSLNQLPDSAMVAVVGDTRMLSFQRATSLVWTALRAIDTGRKPPEANRSGLVGRLVADRQRSVHEVVERLVEQAAEIHERWGWTSEAFTPELFEHQLEVPVIATPPEFAHLTEHLGSSGLYEMKKTFVSMHDQFLE